MKYYVSAGLKTLSFFLILPIATHLLPKAEVGKFFFWIAAIQLGAGITTLGLSSAVARRSYNRNATDYVAGAGLIVAVVTSLAVASVGILSGLLTIAVALAWLARSTSLLGEARTVARGEINRLSNIYVAYALLLPLVSLVSVLAWEATYTALLVAFIFAEGAVALFGLSSLRLRFEREFDKAFYGFKRASLRSAKYGLPIMVAGLANLGLNSADRFIVAGFRGFETVAEFSIMYTIAFASNRFITAPANMKIFPEFVRGHRDQQALDRIRRTAGVAWLVSVAYCIFVATLGPQLVRLFLGEQYDIDHLDFAFVSAGSALFLLFTINSAHLKLRNETGKLMLVLFAALAISVTLSVLMVPSLGYRGASISTLISYSCLAVWAVLALRPILLHRTYFVAGALAIIGVIGLSTFV